MDAESFTEIITEEMIEKMDDEEISKRCSELGVEGIPIEEKKQFLKRKHMIERNQEKNQLRARGGQLGSVKTDRKFESSSESASPEEMAFQEVEETPAILFRSSGIATGHSVYVGYSDGTVNEEQLRSLFVPLGEVVSVQIVHDEVTGNPRGFAYVEFADEDSMHLAVQELNGTHHFGSALVVKTHENMNAI